MLSRSELKELTEIAESNNYFVSLYLNVDPVTNPGGEFILQLKNMIKDVTDGLDRDVLKKVSPDLEKIASYITSNRRQFKKGIILFSSSEMNFWREYNLSLPLRNLLVVEKTPFIKPITDILDNNPGYLILLVDKESARIFIVKLGEIIEYGEVHTPDVPGRHKKGGWFSLSETHYKRHIDYHVTLHLKEVVKRLEPFVAGEKIDVIFLGGSDEACRMFKDMLPETVKAKVAGEFSAEMFLKPDEVLDLSRPLLAEYESKKERKISEELITRSMKGDQAVLGIEDVLHASVEGKINTLVFVKDLRESGYRCKKCSFLTVQSIEACPYCGESLTRVEYIVDLVAQKAVDQGAVVEVLSYETDTLNEKGGIGAILRF
jgi:peptide chain release factor subunit 1